LRLVVSWAPKTFNLPTALSSLVHFQVSSTDPLRPLAHSLSPILATLSRIIINRRHPYPTGRSTTTAMKISRLLLGTVAAVVASFGIAATGLGTANANLTNPDFMKAVNVQSWPFDDDNSAAPTPAPLSCSGVDATCAAQTVLFFQRCLSSLVPFVGIVPADQTVSNGCCECACPSFSLSFYQVCKLSCNSATTIPSTTCVARNAWW
jgi:hypothetical protein